MIRVLQVFGRMDRGGSETLMMEIYRNIDRKKIQFDFLVHTNEECAYDQEILSLGGRIIRVPRYNVFNHFGYIKILKNIFQKNENNWKIVHNHYYTISFLIYKVLKDKNIKFIVHSHSTSIGYNITGFVRSLMVKDIKNCDCIKFACSKKAGEFLFKGKTFFLFNNCIDLKKFTFDINLRKELRKELNLEGKIVIGNVGSIFYPKNHSFLIDIFYEFQKLKKDSMLILVGKGDLEKRIKRKVKNLNLEKKVIFLGVRNDVNRILNSFDIFVFPSLYEGFPVTLVESQANGLKSIVSDRVPEEAKITELVDFLPLEKGAEYWAKYILNSLDYERKDRIDELTKAGYDVKEKAGWLEKFYEELITKK